MPKIKINDINLYYQTHGHGEPIVFVAGFSGDHTIWQNIVPVYAKKYQVIVFDNRGIGMTDCPNYPYTTEMMADDAAGLIKALQLKPVHLIGASFGGCIAQNVAYKYPDLIKSVVIANSFVKASMRGSLYATTRLAMIKAGVPEKIIMQFITALCWSNKYLSKPGMLEQLTSGGFFPITLQGYESQMNAMLTFDSHEWLAQIKAPSLVIASDDDVLADLEQAKEIAAAIPNTEYYCFKDAGHVPQIEQPELFNEIVLAFLDKQQTQI